MEVIATLMESDLHHEKEAWTSSGDLSGQFSPLRTILRFSSNNSPRKDELPVEKNLRPPYKLVSPSTSEIDGKGSFSTDGVSVGDEECSIAFFDRFIKEFVDDAILGEERTIVTMGSSSQSSQHPFFVKGLAHPLMFSTCFYFLSIY